MTTKKDKASKIKLLLLDVDGVLTDGRITLNERGEESKTFNVRDGLGLKMLMARGVEAVIVTGRSSQALSHRAGELGIQEVYQGVADKRALCRQVRQEKGFERQDVCAIGDDLPDLGMFRESGLRVAVADAARELREAADLTTQARGGHGAVRELIEWLLKCQDKWHDVPAEFAED